MFLLAGLLALTSSIDAAPSINLPINSQVPPVAIANQAYDFVFSSSTFTTTASSITYILGDCPSWLQLDSPSRTFYGTPGSDGVGPGEVGSFIVDLVATDGNGSTTMPVTFVITTDSGPGLGTPIAAQLPAFGAFSSPDVLLLTPGSTLSVTFSPNTFTDTDANTMYYAICANNIPLPSWVTFDPSSLTFSGITPEATSPSELPQTFGIQLTASEIMGFRQAVASFALIVESHLFTFGNSLQIINITVGSSINFMGLQSDLTIDGRPTQPSDIAQIMAEAPSWLSLNNDTLALSGTAPLNAVQQNFTVTAIDKHGDYASTVVLIQVAGNSSVTLFSPIATLNAAIGTSFSYALNTTLGSNQGVNVSVDPGTASAWLEFDSSSLELHGHVPSNLKPQTVQFNITVTQGSQSQSQIVSINVVCGSSPCPIANSHSASPKATTGAGATPSSRRSENQSWVAAAVVVPLAAIAGFLILFCCYRRRGWKLRLALNSKKLQKIIISRPITQDKDEHIEAQAGLGTDSELTQGQDFSKTSKAPRISGLWASGLYKHNSRARLSKATHSELKQNPRPDSWQSYVRKLEPLRPKHPTAVPEFSLIAEEQTPQKPEGSDHSDRELLSTAEGDSASTDTSPLRRFSRRKTRASNMSYGGSETFSIRPISGYGHGRNGPGIDSNILPFGNKGVGHGDGGIPSGPPGWGIVRNSWRNLSRLSWTSTQSPANSNDPVVMEGTAVEPPQKSFTSMISSFPRPSTSNTVDNFTRPHVIHEASDDEEGNMPVRHVKPLPRNPLKARPISPFRRYGSTKHDLLQDFHKSRLREGSSRNPLFAARLSSSRKPSLQIGRDSPERQSNGDFILEPVTPQKQMISRSYSQSSSLEPPSFRISPTRSSRSVSSPRGKRSRINYSFKTRALSPLRRSRSSYSTTGSSKYGSALSEAQNIGPYDLNDTLREETDNEGNKRWRYAGHPNPLGTNRSDAENMTDVSDGELIESLRAAGRFSAAQRLSYMNAQLKGSRSLGPEVDTTVEVKSARGKRLDHDMGFRHDDPGNTSLRGDIGDAGGSSAFM